MSATIRVLALALLVVSGCSQPLTQLVLVVDTDFPVPDGLDHVVLEVEGAAPRSVEVPLATTTLPISLGVVHRAGPLSPITLTASGQRGGIEIVRGVVRTGFVVGETREVRIDLLRRCEGACLSSSELTCRGGSCVSVDVPAASLPVFTGVPSRSDVGPSTDVPIADAADVAPDAPMLDAPALDTPVPADAPTDTPLLDGCMFTGAEVCNGRDDNCDGAIDEGVCTCVPACMLDHATAFCVGGTSCVIASCETGYADCDGMDLTGCERSTRLPTSCGDCTSTCTLPDGLSGSARGTVTCASGTCMMATCDNADRRDCDGSVLNGCETNINSNVLHCGSCESPCPGASPRCMGGTCR